MMKQLCTLVLALVASGLSFAANGVSTQSSSLPTQGKAVFDKWCAMCHAATDRMPGTASLQAKYSGSLPAALEERKDMTPEFVRHFVRNGVMIMPAFRKTEINDAELDALSSYLSNKK